MPQKSLLYGLVMVLLAACSASDAPEGALGDATVLRGARLIDGNGGAPIENAVLVIRGDRIESVGPADSVTVPEGAEVIDLTGKTIMPAIVSLHGHLASMGDSVSESAKNYTEENVRAKLNQYARFGVLHITSEGSDKPLAVDIRRRQAAGEFPGARLYSAGRGFGVAGGYPPVQPDAADLGLDVNRPASPAEVSAMLADLVSQEVQWVKMWVDHHFGTLPAFNPATYQAIITEAHDRGLRAVAHIFTLADAVALVDAGVDGLLHSVRDQPVSQELIDKMKANDVFSVSTLAREESQFIYAGRTPYLDDPFFTANISPLIQETVASQAYQDRMRANPELARWEPALRTAQRNLKTLFDGGVKIGFGSDSGPPGRFEGYFEHREMELMAEAGLTPAQIIQIASRNSAEILGIAQDYGTVQAGKMAEFLVLGANPLDNISNTKTLEQVWQGGRRITGQE